MKVVLFCGGQGTRLRDYSTEIPKPLVPVGGMPILWHMMKYYAAQGHNDFVLCLGYKSECIREFFAGLSPAQGPRRDPGDAIHRQTILEPDTGEWRITFVDTGPFTCIGGRLLRVREHVAGEEMFLCNYADVLTDLDLNAMIAAFGASDAVAGFCAVAPPYTFHLVTTGEGNRVTGMADVRQSGMMINGGYMVMRPDIFDNLEEGEELVIEGFARLIAQDRLMAWRHDGFWMPMDTLRERTMLEDMAKGDAPWQVWSSPRHVRARADSF